MLKILLRVVLLSALFGLAVYCYSFLNQEKNPTTLRDFVNPFSRKLESEMGLTYLGVRLNIPPWKDPKFKNVKSKYIICYSLDKTPEHPTTIDQARCLIVSIAEAIQHLILEDPDASKQVGATAFSSGDVQINLSFLHNNALVPFGVAYASIMNGKIVFEKYTIDKAEFPYPVGKLSLLHEESYVEGLEIVQAQGCLKSLL